MPSGQIRRINLDYVLLRAGSNSPYEKTARGRRGTVHRICQRPGRASLYTDYNASKSRNYCHGENVGVRNFLLVESECDLPGYTLTPMQKAEPPRI